MISVITLWFRPLYLLINGGAGLRSERLELLTSYGSGDPLPEDWQLTLREETSAGIDSLTQVGPLLAPSCFLNLFCAKALYGIEYWFSETFLALCSETENQGTSPYF